MMAFKGQAGSTFFEIDNFNGRCLIKNVLILNVQYIFSFLLVISKFEKK